MRKIIIFNLLTLIIITISCKKKDEIKLSHQYSGILTYEYSRNFPDFDCAVSMALVVDKDGTVTFGQGAGNSFEGEDIYYDGSDPALKMKVTGTVQLISAQGQYEKIDNKDCLLVWVNAKTSGTRYIWNWDKNTQTWVVPSSGYETPIDYTDTYTKGQLKFSIEDATASGSNIKDTVPDVHGDFIYGYGLNLMESSN